MLPHEEQTVIPALYIKERRSPQNTALRTYYAVIRSHKEAVPSGDERAVHGGQCLLRSQGEDVEAAMRAAEGGGATPEERAPGCPRTVSGGPAEEGQTPSSLPGAGPTHARRARENQRVFRGARRPTCHHRVVDRLRAGGRPRAGLLSSTSSLRPGSELHCPRRAVPGPVLA